MSKRIISLGIIILGVAVVLGAFAAHALKGRMDTYGLEIWQKAIFYQVMHGFALIVTGIIAELKLLEGRKAEILSGMFAGGILIFCGSLYLLALTQVRSFGAITPIGGILFIAAWFVMFQSIRVR